jgi:hypothetical protein
VKETLSTMTPAHIGPMHFVVRVTKTVAVDVARTPADVFDFVTAVDTPAKTFAGFGLIPGVVQVAVEDGGPLRVGAVCITRSTDGSVMRRVITVLDRPTRHEYRIEGGFRRIFRMMVRHGIGAWTFAGEGPRTHLVWTYRFELKSLVWYPVVALIMSAFFGRAMVRCVAATKTLLESGSTSTPGNGRSAF